MAWNSDHVLNDTITDVESALQINIWTGNWRVKRSFFFVLFLHQWAYLCDASKTVLLGTIQKKRKNYEQTDWSAQKTLKLIQRSVLKRISRVLSVMFLFSFLHSVSTFMIWYFPHSVKCWIQGIRWSTKKAEGAIEGRGSVNWSWIDLIDKSKQDSEVQYNVNPPFPRCCIWVAKRSDCPSVRWQVLHIVL